MILLLQIFTHTYVLVLKILNQIVDLSNQYIVFLFPDCYHLYYAHTITMCVVNERARSRTKQHTDHSAMAGRAENFRDHNTMSS